MNISVKRVYDEAARGDGTRILVDRLWPRGLTKEKAKVDLWMTNVAPSTELRKWYGHDPEKASEFKKRYKVELKENKEAVAEFKKAVKKLKRVTLLYTARDGQCDHANVLKELLSK